MSTQSPTPPTPKGPRSNNNRRNQKKNTTPYTQKVALLTTPPSSPPRNLSPGGTTTDSSNNANLSKKKNGRSAKKPRDAPKASPAPNNAHRHTSSHPNSTTPQMRDSPHYAGPTFHASPAPSALPMPSFFSKSMPDPDLPPAIETDSDNQETEPEPDFETTPSKPKSRPHRNEQEPKSTPLDFLFKAAVEARNSSNAQRSPEAISRIRSPQTDSKALPQRKHNGMAGGMFPLEMENSDMCSSQIGPSFATSYKDRMNALRSASTPSQFTTNFEEDERRAKTEALKSLLLNPRPQRPSSASPIVPNQATSFKEPPNGSPNVPHFATPLRTTSGPPATLSHGFSYEQKQPAVGNGVHYSYPYAQMSSPQQFSSPYATYNQPNFVKLYPQHPMYETPTETRAMPATNPSSQTLDTKKMEDDLRKILKLDVNPGIPSSGVQSSFA
ncbi:hypothetical protein ASPWEDRAFT_102917 [Aspergillus wentii DTO 134E9]|uniref:Uncharacterized protein n=1 Tax=Aspergillus wentii DTO 134E9 TaxID=1073089 RepID=A0A1L9S2D3_ASPWE|nr:uncharacterized protein ASPWEDRAFT_102917 [Aspergillus wentii DTO 134E9]OJJ41318.1 hypothetical protein ASPWEDRAFT_102917 [Aspergillus wentii DTO 134E9]